MYEFPRKLPGVESSYHLGFEIPEVSRGNATSFKHKLTTEFATVGANGTGFISTVIWERALSHPNALVWLTSYVTVPEPEVSGVGAEGNGVPSKLYHTKLFPVLKVAVKGVLDSSTQYVIGLVTVGAEALGLTVMVTEPVNDDEQSELFTEIRLISTSVSWLVSEIVAKPAASKTTVWFAPESIEYTTVAFGDPVIVKIASSPEQIEGEALKLAVGTAFTVRSIVAELEQPSTSVPITEYVVFEVGETVMDGVVSPPGLQT